MKDIKNLKPGDVLPLEETLTTPIKVKIGNDTHLLAQAGISNNKIAAQIIFINQAENASIKRINNLS